MTVNTSATGANGTGADVVAPARLDIWTVIFAVAVVLLASRAFQTFRVRKKMPPGPIGLPLVGNKHQMPATKPWRKFEQLNKEYGPVVSLFFGSTPIIGEALAHALILKQF